MRIGFVGAGNMAEAMMKGIITGGVAKTEDLIASEIVPERRDYITNTLGVQTVSDNIEVVRSSDVVVLAVKPHHVGPVLDEQPVQLETKRLTLALLEQLQP